MQAEEHETHIWFDYASNTVKVYTTREGVRNGILRRLGPQEGIAEESTGRGRWSITIPMDLCRSPELICKLLNEEEKTPMSEEQKAALRAIG